MTQQHHEALAPIVEALVAARQAIAPKYKEDASYADLFVSISKAAETVAEMGSISMCEHAWCTNRWPEHPEHTASGTIASSSTNSQETISIGTAVDTGDQYEDEIRIAIEEPENGTSAIYLTVDQAREAISLIEQAITNRATIRGAK